MIRPLDDVVHRMRLYTAEDPEGHRWMFGQRIATLRSRSMGGAYLLDLPGLTRTEALALQRSLAGAVSQGAIPDTVILLEHEAVVTLGRRTDEAAELHLPEGIVEVVETDRGGKSTYHGPGTARLLPDPRPEPSRARPQEVRPRPRAGDRRCPRTLRPAGRADRRPHRSVADRPRRFARDRRRRAPRRSRRSASARRGGSRRTATRSTSTSIRRPSRSGSRPAAFEDAHFTTMAHELGRPLTVDDVRRGGGRRGRRRRSSAVDELDALTA